MTRGLVVADLIGAESTPLVSVTRGNVRFIIINRSEARNAMTRDMRRDFAVRVAEAGQDESVRAVIVTGAGGAFCAGVDIRESRSTGPRPLVRPNPGEALRALGKPVIAAVDGACVTGGLEIALSCSFLIASDRSRFADTHARVGLVPAWGMSALLPRAIGRRRAVQMMATGAFVDAATACDWGLVNEITTPDGFLCRSMELAEAMAETDADSLGWQLGLILRHEDEPMAAALAAEEGMVARWRARP
ncbi:MAG: enoyl-CoA hydratase-related protein [Sphingomonadales bacterium]